MSHAICRGAPFASQLHLDNILDEVLRSRGVTADPKARAGVSVQQLMYHCLKKNPDDVFMINGATGEKITNGQILKQAIPLAQKLQSKGLQGKTVLMTMDNHRPMAVTYFALLFAGTLPFFAPSISTRFEIVYFLKLVEPCMVFCDEVHFDLIQEAVKSVPGLATEIMVSDRDELPEANDPDLQFPDVDVGGPLLMLPTSGSTGMPKSCLLTHQGFISQIPMIWCKYNEFPSPLKLGLLLGNCSSISFSVSVISCLVYRVVLLTTHKTFSLDHLKELMVTYRPQTVGLTPSITQAILPALSADDLSSLEGFALNGAPSNLELRKTIKDKLKKSAFVYNFYGMTEVHGAVTTALDSDPLGGANHVSNIFDFKLVNDNGEEVGPGESGELYLRGPAVFKGYYKNQAESEESFADGWLRTGDVFHLDEDNKLVYSTRKKFNFEILGQRGLLRALECAMPGELFQSWVALFNGIPQKGSRPCSLLFAKVSPEEIEGVINSVPGVLNSVVFLTEGGPTAVVVVASKKVTREVIHEKVTDNLSKHKWLNGGIAFVRALPHSHTGKIHRGESFKLLQELIRSGECFQSWRTILDLNKFR